MKVFKMPTDPRRIRADIPGRVEGNTVFIYHDLFNSNKKQVEDLKQRYRNGKVGDTEVKQLLFEAIKSFLEPIRARRKEYENSQLVEEIIKSGTEYARKEFKNTLKDVQNAIGYTKVWSGFGI